ncbi:MAG: PEP-CTERM sorting domain-containing protein [Prosthecobacter sp.]|nr:PEP-CTERM sorting domain-containing protein [Prosthecobacter sp.]
MKAINTRLLAVAGLFLLAPAAPSHAANVVVDFAASYNDPTPVPFSSNNDPAEVTQATGPLSGSLSQYTTTATATADFGSLLVSSITNTTIGDASASTSAKAGWVDSLTIVGGSGLGSLKLYFSLSGSLAAANGGDSSNAQANYVLSGAVNGNSFSRFGQEISSPASSGFLGDAMTDFNVSGLNFTFGTPFDLNFSLEAYSSYSGSVAASSGSASASNLQLTLTGIEVYDQFNGLVSSPGIGSDSGIAYGVPEPSRVLLLASGTTSLLFRRRKASAPTT